MGTVALRSGDVRSASREFALSVDLKTRAYAKSPKDKQLAADLADSLSWQASAQLQLGELLRAESLYARELALLQSLHDSYPTDILWLNRLSSAWSHQSELKQARGELGASHESVQQAHTLLRGIVEKDPSNRTWQRNMYIAELRMLETGPHDQQPAQVLTRLDRLEQSFADLSRLEPKKLNLQMLIADVQQRKAAIHLSERRVIQAAASLLPAIDKLQQLHADAPGDQTILRTMVDALLLKAELPPSQDATALDSPCQRVQAVLRPLVKGSADFHVLAPWVKAQACLGQHEQATSARKQLELMSYRDPTYLHYLSTHPLKKAS